MIWSVFVCDLLCFATLPMYNTKHALETKGRHVPCPYDVLSKQEGTAAVWKNFKWNVRMWHDHQNTCANTSQNQWHNLEIKNETWSTWWALCTLCTHKLTNWHTNNTCTNKLTNWHTTNNAIHTACFKDSKVIATIAENEAMELQIVGKVKEKAQENPKERVRSKAAKALDMV